MAFVRRSAHHTPVPDIFCMALPVRFEGYFPGFSKLIRDHHDYLTWAVLKAHTHNRAGSVTLQSADPRTPPIVNFRYFEEGGEGAAPDLDAVVEAIQFVRRLTLPLIDRGVIAEELSPGRDVSQRRRIGGVRARHRLGPPRVVLLSHWTAEMPAACSTAPSPCTARAACAWWTLRCFRASRLFPGERGLHDRRKGSRHRCIEAASAA